MRKIVFLIPNLMSGGAEKVFVNLANYISQYDETEVYLISSYDGFFDSIIGPDVKKIDIKNRSFVSILNIFRGLNPDILVSTLDAANIRSSLIKLLLGGKTVYISRIPSICTNWKKHKGLKNKIHSFLGGLAYRYSDYIIANSPDSAESCVYNCNVKRDKIEIIGNPVLYESQINDNIPLEKHAQRYILSVGSFKIQKRFDLLLKVFKIISTKDTDVQLWIAGDGGNLKNEILQLVNTLGLIDRVKLLGRQTSLDRLYANAECLLLTSEIEGFGNVIVESMACGTIPICFNCPGGPHYILEEGKYGVLVPFGDTNKMADSVLKVMTGQMSFDKQLLRERARYFSIEKMGAIYYKTINSFYQQKFGEK